MPIIRTASIGLALGLLIAAVRAFVERGDVSGWNWVLIPLVVVALLVWLGGHFDQPRA